jgi:tRNA A37 threonylcarbamoyladenosine modification protein TsaB
MMLLASGVKAFPHHIIAVIDAKRSDVYYGIYHWEGEKLIIIEENVDGFEALIERLNAVKGYEQALLIGDATINYPEIADQWRGVLGERSLSIQRAGNLNLSTVLEKSAETAYTAKANYMRKSQAERDR